VPAGGAVILTYHRISSGRDPMLQCVAPDRFAEQVDAVRREVPIVPLRQIAAAGDERRVAITFDDGYADNAALAAPILRAAGAPATFFVPSRVLTERSEYWWDRLEHHHLDAEPAVPTVVAAPAGRRVSIDVRSDEGRARSLKALNRRLRVLAFDDVDPAVQDVARQLGADADPRCNEHALLDRAAVAALAADPLFEIGSHGVTHTMLSALTADAQEAELRGSRVALEAAAGHVVESLAYPYGTPESVTAATVAAARRAGYARACVNTPGVAGGRSDAFRLPRCMVYDWSGAELVARLRDWFAAR
jgi:peptidoglycan/xylan/chitin deacetylase (PgdA/CDA1 family)